VCGIQQRGPLARARPSHEDKGGDPHTKAGDPGRPPAKG
jgi:hypothetical protein